MGMKMVIMRVKARLMMMMMMMVVVIMTAIKSSMDRPSYDGSRD